VSKGDRVNGGFPQPSLVRGRCGKGESAGIEEGHLSSLVKKRKEKREGVASLRLGKEVGHWIIKKKALGDRGKKRNGKEEGSGRVRERYYRNLNKKRERERRRGDLVSDGKTGGGGKQKKRSSVRAH